MRTDSHTVACCIMLASLQVAQWAVSETHVIFDVPQPTAGVKPNHTCKLFGLCAAMQAELQVLHVCQAAEVIEASTGGAACEHHAGQLQEL